MTGTNDTELGLYSSTGVLLGSDDDSGTGNVSLLTLTLNPGDYYLAAGAFNTVFSDGFVAQSTSADTGTLIINGITLVPEPTLMGLAALIAIGAMGLRRSRTSVC